MQQHYVSHIHSYAIEVTFLFNQTTGRRKILDFKNLTSDAGVYIDGVTPVFDPSAVGTFDLEEGAGQLMVWMVTRSASSQVVEVWANGARAIVFNDSTALATASVIAGQARFILFEDDMTTNGAEASGTTRL